MKNIELIMVVEVPAHKKVLCQADGCGHAVFRRVHVIHQDGDIGVFGSSCAKKLLGERLEKMRPTIGGGVEMTLSDIDVDLLIHNTEELIDKLLQELEIESKTEAALEFDYPSLSDAQLEKVCLDQAKQNFREKRGLNPDAPGWAGWVKSDAKKLFKKLRE